ncbi:hypothetical protein W97_02203 [Coniosporium apollinis CBS 100218]|uniref:Uncharacterized protein n=1 Tax=Coniosporium apollinis (strain CBS 100218) TaxID=1168221 RepID=R7YM44_CONA1|nr:uncharacterized protein W97_02203 [Coniosporium apollinis CBS 100218]EON62977.1 hypothetical protein W97_02203 [Coniosporium apollinis CBS 100218]
MSLPGMLPPSMAGGQQNTGGMSDQEMKMVKAVRPPSPGAQGGHVQSTLRSSRMESCPVKTVIAGVMGMGLGAMFGLFMSSASLSLIRRISTPS